CVGVCYPIVDPYVHLRSIRASIRRGFACALVLTIEAPAFRRGSMSLTQQDSFVFALVERLSNQIVHRWFNAFQSDSLSRRVWRCATTPERRDSSPASFCRVSSPSGCRVQFRRGCSVR